MNVNFWTPLCFEVNQSESMRHVEWKERITAVVDQCFSFSGKKIVVICSNQGYQEIREEEYKQSMWAIAGKVAFIVCFPLSFLALMTKYILRNRLNLKLILQNSHSTIYPTDIKPLFSNIKLPLIEDRSSVTQEALEQESQASESTQEVPVNGSPHCQETDSCDLVRDVFEKMNRTTKPSLLNEDFQCTTINQEILPEETNNNEISAPVQEVSVHANQNYQETEYNDIAQEVSEGMRTAIIDPVAIEKAYEREESFCMISRPDESGPISNLSLHFPHFRQANGDEFSCDEEEVFVYMLLSDPENHIFEEGYLPGSLFEGKKEHDLIRLGYKQDSALHVLELKIKRNPFTVGSFEEIFAYCKKRSGYASLYVPDLFSTIDCCYWYKNLKNPLFYSIDPKGVICRNNHLDRLPLPRSDIDEENKVCYHYQTPDVDVLIHRNSVDIVLDLPYVGLQDLQVILDKNFFCLFASVQKTIDLSVNDPRFSSYNQLTSIDPQHVLKTKEYLLGIQWESLGVTYEEAERAIEQGNMLAVAENGVIQINLQRVNNRDEN